MQEHVLVGSSGLVKASCLICCFTDINECATNNGNCGQVCTNTVGSYTCSCNSGYSLNADARTCAGRDMIYLQYEIQTNLIQTSTSVQPTMEIAIKYVPTLLEVILVRAQLVIF